MSGRSDQIGLCEKRRNKESIKTGSSGDTGEEEERMVERQSDRESWQPNVKGNERKSGRKETQRETEKKNDDF